MKPPSWEETVASTEPFSKVRWSAYHAIANYEDGEGRLIDELATIEEQGAESVGLSEVGVDRLERRPSQSTKPTLYLALTEGRHRPIANLQGRSDLAIDFTLWTAVGDLSIGERLYRRICEAAWSSRPPGDSREYWRIGSGSTPTFTGPFRIERRRPHPGGPAGVVWRWQIGASILWTPYRPPPV